MRPLNAGWNDETAPRATGPWLLSISLPLPALVVYHVTATVGDVASVLSTPCSLFSVVIESFEADAAPMFSALPTPYSMRGHTSGTRTMADTPLTSPTVLAPKGEDGAAMPGTWPHPTPAHNQVLKRIFQTNDAVRWDDLLVQMLIAVVVA